MSRVGVIGDTHLPAGRKGYLEFTQDIFEVWRVDKIVHIGDLVDWHAVSFHASEPQCPGPSDEYELALEQVQRWTKAYKKVLLCKGNHDERPARLAKTVKMPEFLIVPYAKLWGTTYWDWQFSHCIDDVLYRHGTGVSGIHPAWNLMNKSKMNVVMGHCHSRAGVKFSVNPMRRFFGMDVGCGVDEKAWQFAYGRDYVERPVLSCGVVIDGHPYLEMMPCGPGEKYHDSRF